MGTIEKMLVSVVVFALALVLVGRAVSEEISKYALIVFLTGSILLMGLNCLKRRRITMEYTTANNFIGRLVLNEQDVLVVTDANDPRQNLKINDVQGEWEVLAALRDYGNHQELESIMLVKQALAEVPTAVELFCDGVFESGLVFCGNNKLLDESSWPALRGELRQQSSYVHDGVFGFAMPDGAGDSEIHIGKSEQGEIRIVVIKLRIHN